MPSVNCGSVSATDELLAHAPSTFTGFPPCEISISEITKFPFSERPAPPVGNAASGRKSSRSTVPPVFDFTESASTSVAAAFGSACTSHEPSARCVKVAPASDFTAAASFGGRIARLAFTFASNSPAPSGLSTATSTKPAPSSFANSGFCQTVL